jgi:hypothetical protein
MDKTVTVKWRGVLRAAKYITKNTYDRVAYSDATSASVSVNGGDAPVRTIADILICLDGYIKKKGKQEEQR